MEESAVPADALNVCLDTNSLLHYRPTKEIPWVDICGHRPIRLLLCMQVVHELDEKKNNARLGDRASRVIRELNSILESGGIVAEGVTLAVFNYEVRREDFPDTLSLDSSDDRIVLSVKKYQSQHLGSQVAVYTEDMGMRLRCAAHGIKIVKPPEDCRLANPQDELTKKLRQATEELQNFRNRLPVLRLSVGDEGRFPGNEPFKLTLRQSWSPVDVAIAMEKVRAEYPKHKADPTAERRSAISMFFEPTSSDWADYNEKLEGFFLDLERYVKNLNTWGENRDRTISFHLWLENGGNVPADDIDVHLTLPPAIGYVAELNSDGAKPLARPSPPQVPQKPSKVFPGSIDPSYLRTPPWAAIRPVATQIAEAIAKGHPQQATVQVLPNSARGSTIHGKIQKLKHGQRHLIGSFMAVFRSWELIKPLSPEFEITAT